MILFEKIERKVYVNQGDFVSHMYKYTNKAAISSDNY